MANTKINGSNINEKKIKGGIDFILTHFEKQHELFPRTIMTSKTRGQIKIDYESDIQSCKDKIFEYFRQALFIDCKINAFPYNIDHTGVELEVRNKTSASFIMIDLDLKDFNNNKEELDMQLNKTIKNLSIKFCEKIHPTVLWTGNGYHIYQPIEGIVFEEYKIFYDYLTYVDNRNLTTEFLRFAEKFFTKGKSDANHLPSVKSCLVRVPWSINSKNDMYVKIIQRWDGNSPAIQWITRDFRDHLEKKRREIGKVMKKEKKEHSDKQLKKQNNIKWIEKLLQTPIEDGRKQCLWRILCPYLVNIRKITKEDCIWILNE